MLTREETSNHLVEVNGNTIKFKDKRVSFNHVKMVRHVLRGGGHLEKKSDYNFLVGKITICDAALDFGGTRSLMLVCCVSEILETFESIMISYLQISPPFLFIIDGKKAEISC